MIMSLLRQYAEGTIANEDLYYLQRKSLDDPFLADALEGYKDHGTKETLQYLDKSEKVKNPFPIGRIIGIAASLLLLSSIFFFLPDNDHEEALTVAKNKAVLDNETNDDIKEVIDIKTEKDLAINEVDAYTKIAEESIAKEISVPPAFKSEPESKENIIDQVQAEEPLFDAGKIADDKTVFIAKPSIEAPIQTEEIPFAEATHAQGNTFYAQFIKKEQWRQVVNTDEKQKGIVVMMFIVDDYGDPQDISVYRSDCKSCEKEANRLLMSGGKWQSTENQFVYYTFTFE